MRRIMVKTFSPLVVAASFSSERATRRTRSWSMPSTTPAGGRFARAVSYWAPIRRPRPRPAARIGRRGPRPAHEVALGRPDRPAGRSLELDGEIGDAAGGDVGGHVDLPAADDAPVDHAPARGRVEDGGGGGQAGLLQRVHQLADRLRVVDPAEELPDGPEVLDVVDQRGAGEGHQQRPRGARPDALGELEDVLGPLGALVLDEVRLVDDHPPEAEVAEPADVAVEHLVVDDDDVGEAVDRVAVALDDRGRAVRCPQAGLARPV